MPNYRRSQTPGACYFFTVTTADRGSGLLVREIDLLRAAFCYVAQRHPFRLDAVCVLPDHIHALWTLPEGDRNFSGRWRLIKAHFSRHLCANEARSPSRIEHGERGIWQRRFWEHRIRDEQDFRQHVDYLHFNPVKHGYAATVKDWPHSSFHRYASKGIYAADWGDAPAMREARGLE